MGKLFPLYSMTFKIYTMRFILGMSGWILRNWLKVLGLTGIMFLMEACYGAPAATYLPKKNYSPPSSELCNDDMKKKSSDENPEELMNLVNQD